MMKVYATDRWTQPTRLANQIEPLMHQKHINNISSPSYAGPSAQTVEEISENRSEDDYRASLDEQNYHYSEGS